MNGLISDANGQVATNRVTTDRAPAFFHSPVTHLFITLVLGLVYGVCAVAGG